MIHKVIKRARQEEGLTQAVLASIAVVPRSQLQILEKGGNVTRETLEKVLAALGLSLAVISRDEIARMREALAELDAVLGKLAEQVAAPPVADPRRYLEMMSRELVDLVRARKGDEAVKEMAARVERQAATLDEQIAEVEQLERERRQEKRAERAGRARRRKKG